MHFTMLFHNCSVLSNVFFNSGYAFVKNINKLRLRLVTKFMPLASLQVLSVLLHVYSFKKSII